MNILVELFITAIQSKELIAYCCCSIQCGKFVTSSSATVALFVTVSGNCESPFANSPCRPILWLFNVKFQLQAFRDQCTNQVFIKVQPFNDSLTNYSSPLVTLVFRLNVPFNDLLISHCIGKAQCNVMS